jgi:aspartyl aminopeptidase
MSSARDTALDLISFIDASPSPYHAAAEALRRLTPASVPPVRS